MGAMIDERTRAALARLTDNERICLMRRLDHQTAKEMAIDLGISPHAVEKRLKMARIKLGVSSSLEAAQLLAASERYGQMGPQVSDLGAANSRGQHGADPAIDRPAWWRIALFAGLGVLVMSLIVVALLAVAPLNAPQGGVAPYPEGQTVLLSDKPAPPAQPSYLVQLTLKQGDTIIGAPRLLVAPGQSARTITTGKNGTRYDMTLSVTEHEGQTYLVKMDVDSRSANGRDIQGTSTAQVRIGQASTLTVGPSDEPLSLDLVVTLAGPPKSR